MKILVISTTTHKENSTSKLVLEEVMSKLKKDHDIDYIDADQLHIVKNLSCYSSGGDNCASKDAGKYRCWAHKLSQESPSEYGGKDEMGVIYDGLEWCDAVIFSTSVRWGSHSALMQKILERMNTLENRVSVFNEKNTLEGKKCGVVVTGHHHMAQSVADHLLTQLTFWGFEAESRLCWQRTLDLSKEQEGDNNKSLKEYLSSEDGKEQVDSFLKTLL